VTVKAKEKMTKARAGLILDNPFFGSLALKLNILEDPTCETGWTDGVSLGYNPTWVDTLSLEKTKGFIAHEIGHIVCLHHTRRGERNHVKWNQAADFSWNDILLAANFVLPDGALSGMGTDKNADMIYNILPDSPEGDKGGSPDKEDGDRADPGKCGEVRDFPGKNGGKATAPELKQAEQNAKIDAAQAAQAAKIAGKLPGALGRFVSNLLEAKVDWRDVLRHFIERVARNDYSWTTPNRRYISQGIYLPSLRSEELGEVVIAVDTSGSVGNDVLQQFISEANSILEEYDTIIHLLPVDTDIHDPQKYSREDLPLKAMVTGGGGTSFSKPFEYTKDLGITPCCLVYLTDGLCDDYPNDTPEYPTLWVSSKAEITPPFGEVIMIN
jgi:predicted metal-dependent peptidase